MSSTGTHERRASAQLEPCVLGHDGAPFADGDLRRLFPGGSLTAARLDRLREWPRVFINCDARIVGAATYRSLHDELLVPDLAISPDCGCSEHDVLHVLLDALETAGLAAGAHRLVLSPPAIALPALERRGYRAVSASCAGCWVEKALLR